MAEYGRVFTGHTLEDFKRFVDDALQVAGREGPFTDSSVGVGPLGQIYWWGRVAGDDVDGKKE